MLVRRPTFEELLRETQARRLKILPERERRTQQGMLLDELDMNDFDLGKYDKKTILMNANPDKGTQTDMFNKTSTAESESAKSVEEDQLVKEEQAESEYSHQTSEASEEKEKQKSLMQRLFDSLFDEVEVDLPRSRPTSQDSGARGSNEAMPNKKSETPPPSSRSLSSIHSRNVLPLASEPENVQSSPSPTIEYLESSPPISVISSGRSRRTIQYLGSSSSRSSRPITISSGSR